MDSAASKPHLVLRVMAFVFLCVGFFLFHTYTRTLVVTQGYEWGRLKAENDRLDSEIVALKVERDRRLGHQNLEALVEQLKARGIEFRPPTSEQLVYTRQK